MKELLEKTTAEKARFYDLSEETCEVSVKFDDDGDAVWLLTHLECCWVSECRAALGLDDDDEDEEVAEW